MKLRDLQAEAEARLRRSGLPSPDVDARRITERASGLDGAELVLALDRTGVTDGVAAHHDAMVTRREQGEPLQYVLGCWGFRTLDLMVDERVLIPRPETEQLVDYALVELDRLSADRARRPMETNSVVVDLGTGSGAVGLSLVAERPGVEVWGVERSAGALAVARANAAGAGRVAARVRLVEGWWFDPLPDELRGTVDVVVANPPYVAAADLLPDEVARWEPVDALVPGPSGLEAIEVIVAGAPAWIAPGGSVLIEIGETQGPAASALARSAGFSDVEVRRDLLGRDRFLSGRLAPRSSPRPGHRWR